VTEPGALLARGRACDVYEVDAHRVLRRYRKVPYTSLEVEAEIMERARANAYPVPRVHEVTDTDLVMDRIEGPTMLEELTSRPWRLREYARALASLHHRLHDIPAPETLDTPLGEGAVIVHLDLHPLNVIMSPDGPVVIDWSNAARGDGNADVALTYVLLMSGNPDEGAFQRLMAKVGRSLFAKPFLARFVRRDVMAHLEAAAAYKLADPNMSEAEQAAIRRLVATTRR
jgi:aminoglycoside phosphotransferase (APT) family kinase protein